MTDLTTQQTDASVEAFIDAVPDERRRADSRAVLALMREVTGLAPAMWGPSIVGFGRYHYKYASGHEGDAPLAGFSPRKASLTLYIIAGFDTYEDLLRRLGKHETGKACLYIDRLEDVDQDVLRQLVRASFDHMRATNT